MATRMSAYRLNFTLSSVIWQGHALSLIRMKNELEMTKLLSKNGGIYCVNPLDCSLRVTEGTGVISECTLSLGISRLKVDLTKYCN